MTAEILAILLDGRRRDAGQGADRTAETGENWRVRLFQMERDRIRIDHLGFLDRSQDEDEGKRARIVVGMILVRYAIEVELDGVGVEVRAVVKLDALAQLERICLGVRTHRPRFRQARFDIETAVLVVQQTFVNVAEDAEVADGDRLSRIQCLQLGEMAHDQDALRRLGPSGNLQRGQGHQARGDAASA
jgi:hypothetical protein